MECNFRIGHGYDVHRLVEGRKCIIGGVEIPSKLGLLGHSDADVLTHALADSILGALALPDIGFYFPPSDPNCEGIDSQEILKKAVAEATGSATKWRMWTAQSSPKRRRFCRMSPQ